jgi:hypothetical protein
MSTQTQNAGTVESQFADAANTISQAKAELVATGVKNAAHKIAQQYEKTFILAGIEPLGGVLGETLREGIEFAIVNIFLSEIAKAVGVTNSDNANAEAPDTASDSSWSPEYDPCR